MNFFEKYEQLQNEAFLIKLLTDSVYATMCLEDQEVPKTKIYEIVLSIIEDQKLKGFNFLQKKVSNS